MTTRLRQAMQDIGLATCGRLGARLASRLGMATSWMTIVRRVMALPTKPAEQVQCLGIDDFSDLAWQNVRHGAGRSGYAKGSLICCQTVKQKPPSLGCKPMPKLRMSAAIGAVSMPAPPLVALLKPWRLADRFHVAKNLSEAVQDLLARVLTELKDRPQGEETALTAAQGEIRVPVEEWRPAPGEQVKRTISTHRAEREARYQQVEYFQKQGLTAKEIAHRLRVSERTVRHWRKLGVAPDVRPRRKRQSDARSLCALRAQTLGRRGTQRNTSQAAKLQLRGIRAPSAWSIAS
jgi:transposase